MRRTWLTVAIIAALCAVPVTLTVMAQAPGYGTGAGSAPATGAQDENGQAEPQRNYIRVLTDNLQRFPDQYLRQFIQVADYYGEPLTQFPTVLQAYNVLPQTHLIFRTHKASGSNMLCFVSRENEDAKALAYAPVVPEAPIYLMGQVGPRTMTEDGLMTIFAVDRIVMGHTAPVAAAKKEVRMVLEWQTERGMQKKEYKIPKSGQRYEVQDPFDPTKTINVTLHF